MSMNMRGILRTGVKISGMVAVLVFAGSAIALPITHTDSFGIVWTLTSDGVNHGTTADPTYNLFVLANTTGFSTSSHSINFTYTNSYINFVSIQAATAPTSASTTLGPGDFTNASLWTNVTGGQNSNQCDGSGTNFDCAYSTAGGNSSTGPTGPGVLMNTTQANPNNLGGAGFLEWEFILHFPANTTNPLSFATLGSHLKVDYYGYTPNHQTGGQDYSFIGQISDDVTINSSSGGGGASSGGNIPEPATLALVGLGLLAVAAMGSRSVARAG
jgi:PEP-CTERM motif